MTLLAPAWLLVLALAGFIAIIHARRRLRIAVPSVMIWRVLGDSGAGRPKLRWPPPSWLLWLQLLIVAAIALALAQPRLGTDRTHDHTIFLIDVSASMRATDVETDRFSVARDRLEQGIAGIGDQGGRVSVITVGSLPRIIVARQSPNNASSAAMRFVEPTDTGAEWRAALDWVTAILRQDEVTRLVLLTDTPGVAAMAAMAAHPGMERIVVPVGSGNTANAGISAFIDPDAEVAGRWRVVGEVNWAGQVSPELSAELLFRPSGAGSFLNWGQVPIDIDPDEDEVSALGTTTFETTIDLPGAGELMLRLPDDSGPHDNEFRLAVPDGPRILSVLIIGEQDPDIVRALSAFEHVELAASIELPESAADIDLVIVDGVSIDDPPATNLLWLGGASPDGPDTGEIEGAYVTAWRADHPLSRDVNWGVLTDLETYQTELVPGAAALVMSGTRPLIQARTKASGREIVAGLATESWRNTSAFPVFLGNVIDWLGVERGYRDPCIAGVPCAIDARLLGAGIEGPDGEQVRVPLDSAALLPSDPDRPFVPMEAGFYRLADMVIAVNSSSSGETDLALINVADGGRLSPAPVPIFQWIIAVVLAGLLVEAYLAGRGSERFLHSSALRSGVPLSGRRRVVLSLRIVAALLTAAALLTVPLPARSPVEQVIVVTADFDGAHGAATTGVGWLHTAGPEIVGDIGEPPRRPIDLWAGAVAEALALAVAMLPDRSGRIVLDSDFITPGGSNAIIAELDSSLTIDAIASEGRQHDDVAIVDVALPPNVRDGDRIPVDILVHSTADTPARIAIRANGAILAEEAVTLAQGVNRIETILAEPVAGRQTIDVSVEAEGDIEGRNNHWTTIVEVGPRPSVLVLSSEQVQGTDFAAALAIQDIDVEQIAPERAPRFLDGWLAYDAIVMMNVPAIALSTRQQAFLEEAVEIHGRGLFLLGGENSFGPGGYYETAFERMSPLSSRIPHETPRAALVFVLDRSGSMQAIVEGAIDRLTLAKEATTGALDLLHAESQVAVVVFDSESRVVVPMQERLDALEIAAQLAPLEPGGGTALYPALDAALSELAGVDAGTKHIVVLTDGLVEPVDFSALLSEAAANDVTISTIAIGAVPRTDRLETIAAAAAGAFHATGDVRALPGIMSREALMLMSSPWKEGAIAVSWSDRSAAFLAGMPDVLPPLQSYVSTTVKPDADVHASLIDDEGRSVPVLASWQYGNGIVVAFASHGAGQGARNWMGMPEYPLLWAQAIRAALPETAAPGLSVRTTQAETAVTIVAELVGVDGNPVSGRVVAAIPDRDFSDIQVLSEQAPGTYRGAFDLAQDHVTTFEMVADGMVVDLAIAPRYSEHINPLIASEAAPLVALGGGREWVALDDALAIGTAWAFRPQWRLWLVAALALLMVELVIRDPATLFRVRSNSG